MKIFDDVFYEHPISLVLRHTGKHVVDDAARVGPVACGVRKVISPHYPIDTDIVAQPQPNRIIDKSPITMLSNICAGFSFQWLNPKVTIHPVATTLVGVIQLLIKIRQPADLGLSPVDSQLRKAIKYSRQK